MQDNSGDLPNDTKRRKTTGDGSGEHAPFERDHDVEQIIDLAADLRIDGHSRDGPGELRRGGPRHDNDKVYIQDIQIAPTKEEILSTRKPYVPFNFPGAPHHLPQGSMERMLDTQFRLLRHELVEPIRAGLTQVAEQMTALSCNNPNVHTYSHLAKLLRLGTGRFEARRGCAAMRIWGSGRLFFEVTTDRSYGVGNRVKFAGAVGKPFQLGDALQYGTLIAVLSDHGTGVRIDLGVVRSQYAVVQKPKDGGKDQPRASVVAHFLDPRAWTALMSSSRQGKRQVLVEMPDIWYEAAAPFLYCLQKANPRLVPFGDCLPVGAAAPNTRAEHSDLPAYIRGSSFDLSGLLRKDAKITRGTSELMKHVDADSRERAKEGLREHGTVDSSQAEAIMTSLFHKVAVIQGPPGTGKSYTAVAILRTLLDSKVGPILILSTTNQALDTILHKVLEQNLTREMVRLGTRSTNETVAKYSLQNKCKKKRSGSKATWKKLRAEEEHVREAQLSLHGTRHWELALSILEQRCKGFKLTNEELQLQRRARRLAVLRGARVIGATMSGAASAAALIEQVKPKVLLVEEAGQVLEAHVLATLVPSVQHLILLGDHQQLRPQIDSFSLSVENSSGAGNGHLYRLDMSMMERLAHEATACVAVSRIVTQRRMRPEICNLVRSVGGLEDDPSVVGRANVKGMPKNVLFFDHNNADSTHGTSRVNYAEADMTVDLVQHLLKQGYAGPTEICIIVAYASQTGVLQQRLALRKITCASEAKKKAGRGGAVLSALAMLEKEPMVRVATIDSVQGEEAKIVVLSLVRNEGSVGSAHHGSGCGGGIGFLKSTNRAYVALSRARDGLFVFGNSAQLRSGSPFWADVLDNFVRQGAIVHGCTNGRPGEFMRQVAHFGRPHRGK